MVGPEMQQQFSNLESSLRSEAPMVSKAEIESLTRLFSESCAEAEKWLSEHQVPVSTE